MLNTLSAAVAGSCVLLLVATCVTGNLLVCLAIYLDSRLRRTENLYLASLAVADLLVAGVMTLAGVNDLLGRWVFGTRMCHLWIAVDIMCCTASIFNLCAIALDRYIHIVDPFRYPLVATKRVVLSSIAAVWLVSGGVSLVSLWFHRSSGPLPLCSLDLAPLMYIVWWSFRYPLVATKRVVLSSIAAVWLVSGGVSLVSLWFHRSSGPLPLCSLDLAPFYAVASSTISFCLPCLVMTYIYWRLYFLSRHHSRTIPNSSDDKAAVTIGIIMGIFLVCWMPFFCANITDALYPDYIPQPTFKLLTWLGYSNSVFNPIVYSVLNRDFRESFKLIIMRRLSKQSVKTISYIDS